MKTCFKVSPDEVRCLTTKRVKIRYEECAITLLTATDMYMKKSSPSPICCVIIILPELEEKKPLELFCLAIFCDLLENAMIGTLLIFV